MKRLLVVVVGLAMFASVAQAQTGRRVSLGAGIGLHKYVDDGFAQKNPGFSILYRLAFNAHPKDGWSVEPKVSFDWYKTDVRTDVLGVQTRIGKLRSIQVYAGAGPAYRHGRTKFGMAVLAGESFNQFTADAGVGPLKVKNAFALKPEAGVWYDVSSRLGLHVGVNYLYSRPSAEAGTGGPTLTAKLKTDRLGASLGFAIGLF